MHGRLKVKTTAEQEAEKQKERAEKLKLYLGGLNAAFKKRELGEHDEEGLKITAQLLMANPDALTLWNFRRETLLAMKSKDDGWNDTLQKELTVIENCLNKNPKSYGAWHHRCWIMKTLTEAPWKEELELCSKYLKIDERNFHCWDYRRFVVAESSRDIKGELTFTRELIERNLSNYSAWHYRTKLLPLIYPPEVSAPHPVAEETLVKELKTVVEAVFTDPADQSPWFFLRWLINRCQGSPRPMQVGVSLLDGRKGRLVCTFTGAVSVDEVPTVNIDGSGFGSLSWTAASDRYSHVWMCDILLPSSSSHEIQLKFARVPQMSIAVSSDCPHKTCHVPGYPNGNKKPLSALARKSLEDIKDNCLTLDEIDAGNKWVLLTLVDVMWSLDVVEHYTQIGTYLQQLKAIDPLRERYFDDMRSKLIIETATKQQQDTAGMKLSLANCALTCVAFTHYFACTESIDLSNNNLSSIAPLVNLGLCKELVLDNNCRLEDISPLSKIKTLQELSLVGCNINNVCDLECLQPLLHLKLLDLKNTAVTDISMETLKGLFVGVEIKL